MSGTRIDSITAKLVVSNLDPDSPQPKDLDCSGCGLCCRGVSPLLTTNEVLSGIYPMSFIDVPPEIKDAVQDARWLVVMANSQYYGCPWLGEDNRCKHYNLRPLACRQFDCRTASNHPFPAIAKLRFGVCAKDKEERELNDRAKIKMKPVDNKEEDK